MEENYDQDTPVQQRNLWRVQCRSVSNKEKRKLVTLNTWINSEGIDNIIYITILEKSGYLVKYGIK